MSAFSDLTEYFRRFPGIGPRQAKRFVYFLLTQDAVTLENFVAKVAELKKEIRVCASCYRFFAERGTAALCEVCRDDSRDQSLLMLVCRDSDLEAIEKSGTFAGRYFVLGGSVPLMEKDAAARIRSRELLASFQKQNTNVKEIILGMNFTPEGENTSDTIRALLSPIIEEKKIKVSQLGRGLSTGTELEYSDRETLKNALQNRQ